MSEILILISEACTGTRSDSINSNSMIPFDETEYGMHPSPRTIRRYVWCEKYILSTISAPCLDLTFGILVG